MPGRANPDLRGDCPWEVGIGKDGAFVWFPLAGGTQELGYFNPEVSGVLTNVEPPQ